MTGTIYKSIGGFYYVKADETGELVECRARGVFRKTGEKPVAGDRVRLAEEAGSYLVWEILPRKNSFCRPPVANVDVLFLVASTVEPTPSLLVLDKLTVLAGEQEVSPVLLITKTDIAPAGPLLDAYATSGIKAIAVNAQTGEGLDAVRAMLAGQLAVFCGNSGVGKTTLLNALSPGLGRETGEISKKLGRGRHTTREVEILELALPEGTGLIADTPGFASLDMAQVASIPKENLQYDFPDISRHVADCQFTGCSHVAEMGCAVKAAREKGELAQGRYSSYVTLYEQAKENEKY